MSALKPERAFYVRGVLAVVAAVSVAVGVARVGRVHIPPRAVEMESAEVEWLARAAQWSDAQLYAWETEQVFSNVSAGGSHYPESKSEVVLRHEGSRWSHLRLSGGGWVLRELIVPILSRELPRCETRYGYSHNPPLPHFPAHYSGVLRRLRLARPARAVVLYQCVTTMDLGDGYVESFGAPPSQPETRRWIFGMRRVPRVPAFSFTVAAGLAALMAALLARWALRGTRADTPSVVTRRVQSVGNDTAYRSAEFDEVTPAPRFSARDLLRRQETRWLVVALFGLALSSVPWLVQRRLDREPLRPAPVFEWPE